MKIAALIATLIIGSSTLALADNGRRDNDDAGKVHGQTSEYYTGNVHSQQQQQPIEIHRAPTPVVTVADPCVTPAPAPLPVVIRHPVHHGWVTLMQPERLTNGQRIGVGYAAGQFNTLELKATRGTSFVKMVSIEFSGGTVQNVKLNQNLTSSLSIDLAGSNRAIKAITVYGSSKTRSASYEILAV